MVKHRFDFYVKELSKEPASRRKFLAVLTVGLIGGEAMMPLTAKAAGSERCDVLCKKGCCSKRLPRCCNKYRLCCPKAANFCTRDGCYR